MDKLMALSQINLLQSLSEEDLAEMDELTQITVYKKRTFIQTPDTFVEKLFYVKSGRVRLFQLNAEGKMFILDILNEGNVFGELNSISLGTRTLYIEAIEESQICTIDQKRFETFMIEHPRMMLNMIGVLSKRVGEMSLLAQSMVLEKLSDKIVQVLVRLAKQFGHVRDGEYMKIELPLSHQELASLVGASREAVTMALQELAQNKVIVTGFRTVYIHHSKL